MLKFITEYQEAILVAMTVTFMLIYSVVPMVIKAISQLPV